MADTNIKDRTLKVDVAVLKKAFSLMATAREMSKLYEDRKDICAKYVHATSKGHEAIQLALALQLLPQDFVAPYYRDDSLLLGIGYKPYDLMLQLLARKDDPFSGGRTYYSHPSSNRADMPKIPHQSSATGMQAIPTTGVAQGIKYKEQQGLADENLKEKPLVVCSLGDASVTEGEVAEAFQMAVLHQYPILYLVQDNNWGISATGAEMRNMNAIEFAKGFKGQQLHRPRAQQGPHGHFHGAGVGSGDNADQIVGGDLKHLAGLVDGGLQPRLARLAPV
jgi:2-oxoisovalerate dehydrogenase E1 component